MKSMGKGTTRKSDVCTPRNSLMPPSTTDTSQRHISRSSTTTSPSNTVKTLKNATRGKVPRGHK